MPDLMCSRKGCRESAEFALRWNNPRLHTEDRRKTWLACADHCEFLETYLTARSMRLFETIPVAELVPE